MELSTAARISPGRVPCCCRQPVLDRELRDPLKFEGRERQRIDEKRLGSLSRYGGEGFVEIRRPDDVRPLRPAVV
jgi:hypothetical protein